MRLFSLFLFILFSTTLSNAAPKKSMSAKTPLNIKSVVGLCGEPDVGYKMPNVLGVGDFMLFVHHGCVSRLGAAAVMFQGNPLPPVIKIAEAIVGLYLINASMLDNTVVKTLKPEFIMMGNPPGSIKITVIMFELKIKKRKKH